ncbi:MAG: chorismate synthase [Anaerolineae bacterium]
MASNSFGTIFRITTWGESHGKALGVVIDGCPAGLELCEKDIDQELQKRAPGQSSFVSSRKEPDHAEILSGVFEGRTTGCPISIIVFNRDANSSSYEPIKHLLRPGHATFTYLKKYGLFDYRGGGRSSGRETVCRVAAGAVAKKLLKDENIDLIAYVKEVGGISAPSPSFEEFDKVREQTLTSPIFCPDKKASDEICTKIAEVKAAGDSLGGIIEAVATHVPAGLGDPIYEKLEMKLAAAMLSIPASKGFEIGSGFEAARMQGSSHNDLFTKDSRDAVITASNFAGGTLGGISTGMPLIWRVAFKPTSSIKLTQSTLDVDGNHCQDLELPESSRHDPCLVIRAAIVVEAMGALVLADALLMNRLAKL